MRISYLTEDPSSKYSEGIRKSKNLNELIKVLNYYREFTADSRRRVKSMSPKDFRMFKTDLPKFKTEKNIDKIDRLVKEWGEIVMPKDLITSSMIAIKFNVPWGCAFIRYKEEENKKLKNKK
jgi:hypothetical protein